MTELLEMAKSGNLICRTLMAENPETPSEVLEVLSNDQELRIRSLVVSNPNTPTKIRVNLLRNEAIKRDIAKRKEIRESSFINPIITPELLAKVLDGYLLDIRGIHGISHWRQVEKNALHLAEGEGIVSSLFSLFALFHDARRKNDGHDREHGKRGATLARKLHVQGFYQIPAEDLDRLCYACEHHTNQRYNMDPIIGICWDADRLDLTRVGTTPNPRYLNSTTAIYLASEKNLF
jgi:uncharacterized protein